MEDHREGSISSPPHFQQLHDLINSDLWTEYVVLCGQEPTPLTIQQRNLLAATIVRTFPIMQNFSLHVLLQEWIEAQIDVFSTKPIAIKTSSPISKPTSPTATVISTPMAKQEVSMRSSMLASRMGSSVDSFPREAPSSITNNITNHTTNNIAAAPNNVAISLATKPKKEKITLVSVPSSSGASFPSSSTASAFSAPFEGKPAMEVKPKLATQHISSTLSATTPAFASSTFPVSSSSSSSIKSLSSFPSPQFQSALDDKPKEPIQMLSVRKKIETTGGLQRQSSTDEPSSFSRSSSRAFDNTFVETTQKDKPTQIANLVHLYSLNLIVFYDHSSFVAPFKASQKISVMSFANLLIKLQKISKTTTPTSTNKVKSSAAYIVNSVDSLILFTKVLVEQLLSVVKGLGKAVIKSILSNSWLHNDSYWSVVSVLQDHLDNIGGSSEQNKSTARLYSNMAESYVKPFSEEDNRNEQKSKDDKDLYKKRGESSDKFHNLFQTFRNLYSQDPQGSELADFFRNDFMAQAQEILNMDGRNMRWFAKIFIGTLVRNYLLMYEQSDSKDTKASAEVIVKLPSSIGNGSTGSSVASDVSAPFQSVTHPAQSASIVGPSATTANPFNSSYSENSSGKSPYPRPADKGTNGGLRSTSSKFPRNQSGKQEPVNRTIPAGFDFEGIMTFFARFVYWLNNHRFNQSLVSVILEEVQKLSSGSSHRLNVDDNSLLHSGGSVENLDTNSFTVSIMTLKILGKTLGLVHFHHFHETFSSQEISESGQWLNQATFPLTELIQQNVGKGRLCQVIPCIVEFLSMLKPIHSKLSSTQLMQNTNVTLGYSALCKLLFMIRWHPDFNLMSDSLSTNQLFVLLEVERLWAMLPHVHDFISNQSHAQDHTTLKFLRSRSVINSLDKANFALCDIALKLLTPELDQLLEKLPSTLPAQTNMLMTRKKNEEFPVGKNSSSMAVDRDKSNNSKLTLQSVPASPASTASKSSMRSFNPMQAGITSKRVSKTPNTSMAFTAQHMHHGNTDRMRFHSSSVAASGTRQYPLSDLKMVSPFRYSSLSHSSTATLAEGNSSVVKKLFAESNQLAMPSAESYGQLEVLDADYMISDHQELLDKMDDSFWNYNKDLCDVHKFVLFYANVIGRERIQDLICTFIHKTSKFLDERVAVHAAALSSFSPVMVEELFQKETETVLQQAIKEGSKLLDNMYDHFLHMQLKLLYSLYTKTTIRTVKLALWKTKFQLQLQKSFLLCHLKEYASRKMFEVKDAKLRRYKDTEKVHSVAGPLDDLKLYRVGQYQPYNGTRVVQLQVDERGEQLQSLSKVFSGLATSQILLEKSDNSSYSLSLLPNNNTTAVWSTGENKVSLLLYASLDMVVSVVTKLAKPLHCFQSDISMPSSESQLLVAFLAQPVQAVFDWLMQVVAALKDFAACTWLTSREFHSKPIPREAVQSFVQVELGKFFLSAFPYLLFADYVSLRQQSHPDDNLTTLYQTHFTSRKAGTILPSSVVHQCLDAGLLLKSTLHKVATMMLREKTANFYQFCKGLHPITKFMKLGMQLFYFELHLHCFAGQDTKVDGTWWQDTTQKEHFVQFFGAEHAEIVEGLQLSSSHGHVAERNSNTSL